MKTTPAERIRTGLPGLDYILRGGLPRHRIYLVQGDPGSGKTTLGLQFLIEGASQGEAVLSISMSETETEIREVAATHGWDLTGVHLRDLVGRAAGLEPGTENTLFVPSEVELNETLDRLLAMVEEVQPSRLVLDSLSELQLLSQDPLRYRRQILRLRQFLAEMDCTVLLLDDRTATYGERQLQSLTHGVVQLEQLAPEYGGARRRLRVLKMRGVDYRGGYHDFVIRTGGLDVFPRLVAAEHVGSGGHGTDALSCGVDELDRLLGGGPHVGTTTLVLGGAGTGKSSLMLLFALAEVRRGGRAALFVFDETLRALRLRAEGLGLDVGPALEAGKLIVRQIDPAELSPGEFAAAVRTEVEDQGARFLGVDSLNGYANAMPEEHYLNLQLHEMLTSLNQLGVITFLVMSERAGGPGVSSGEVSYLADSVIRLYHRMDEGRLRKAIAVVKKRTGAHASTVHELVLGPMGIEVGEALGTRRVEEGTSGRPERAGDPSWEDDGGTHRR